MSVTDEFVADSNRKFKLLPYFGWISGFELNSSDDFGH
jgi:hypothetical protein